MNLTINLDKRSAIAMACIAMVCAVTSASALDVAKPTVPAINTQTASGTTNTTEPQPKIDASTHK